MSFPPIAIVGRGCVFPEALNPAALWALVAGNRDAVTECPEGRWRIPKDRVLGDGPEQASTDRGGYVSGFDRVFDSSGFAIPPSEIASHDPTVHWLLYCAREALREAGHGSIVGIPKQSGAVVGLLGLPSESMAEYAEQTWRGSPGPAISPANRFASGLPAHILGKALNLDVEAFALDAACASSLYAIKLACDALHDGRADLMLAGGVNRADDLFLHIGFSTLKAISRTGASRPFHGAADGLIPAEGAGIVVLKRLEDAEAAGNRILGVIRGIGLSNDGRTAGLLTPSEKGQEQAIRAAYASAALDPAEISLIECHATGTPVGDICEIRSTARVFEGLRDVPIASIKSNLGHPITAAGMAGLLKIMGAIEHHVRPASLHVRSAAEAVPALSESPFRLLMRNEPWDSHGARRAALSGFGFGGNNAHLIVEEYTGANHRVRMDTPGRSSVAVTALGVSAGDTAGVEEFAAAVLSGEKRSGRAGMISIGIDGLGFPPADVAAALPQQVLALQAASEALDRLELPRGRTGVFVGMGCDAEVSRYGLRWRGLARRQLDTSEADAICPPLSAAAVIGRLANIVANRISSKYDLRGPSFSVMAEEHSGMVALRLAERALATGELDAAVVGAVDLSCEPVHERAARELLPADRQEPGDAAVFFILKRLDDARGEALAIVEPADEGAGYVPAPSTSVFGHAHAAWALLESAAAVSACAHGAIAPARPWIAPAGRRAGGGSGRVAFRAPAGLRTKPLLLGPPPRVYVYSGQDSRSLLFALRENCQTSAGPARLAIVASGEQEFAEKLSLARDALESGAGTFAADGVYFRSGPLQGELAMVFPGAGAAYTGMGRTFLLAFPELLDSLSATWPNLISAAEWIFAGVLEPSPADKLWGSSFLSQAHARFTLQMLGLQPQAAIGISSGETNSLAAFGVWRDLDVFFEEFTEAGVLHRVLGGAFAITGGSEWQVWRIAVSRHELEALLANAPGIRLTGIYGPDEYSIAGESTLCSQAVAALAGKAQRLNYDLVIHCPEFAPFAEPWRRLHHRQSFPSPVRFYTHATCDSYAPDRAQIADVLTAQALAPLDFERLVERAWADGVRIFLEQGPQSGCASRIRKILGRREHAAISMDRAGTDSLRQAANAAAELIVAGVPGIRLEAFDRLTRPDAHQSRKMLTVPAHYEPVQFPQPKAQAASLFEVHTRALAASFSGFLESCGAETHEAFLETSQRAYLQAVSRLAAAPPLPAFQLNRRDLEALASGSIADVLGPEFRDLDNFDRVVRMPMPPLLLVDRVRRIEGQALSMGTGAILTETDVRTGAWYMHRGRMAGGVMIEAGQADLLLISWLGIDREVRGNRIYRLLGCDLTYHGGLPQAGETLKFAIHIDRHARQGEVRLFFFHYDCKAGDRLRLSVRNGQAGFFTDRELAESAGILGAPESPSAAELSGCGYSADQVRAAAAGQAYECFGEGFEMAAAHQRSPGFADPGMLLLDTVTHLDKSRGYLRAELAITPDLWFFEGHFKDDPCMPGTLMFEGCLQAMAFYMMACGLSVARDGWRFEPVPDVTYPLRCRGQVVPDSRLLVYELFVDEIGDPSNAVLFADLLCTVDGLKAFYCRRMGLRLTPGHPLDEARPGAEVATGNTRVASVNGVALNYPALLACAWGSPVDAFGPPFARFAEGRLPRLPGPPYHFMTRITQIDGEFGAERKGARVVAEYDVEPGAWFFESAASRSMPLAVLMEIGLQPCGWLACYTGIPLRSDQELFFRNLDGSGTVEGVVRRASGTIRTVATLINVARSAGTTLTSFQVRCDWNGETVLQMQTTFGFFQAEDLSRQAGLPAAPRAGTWNDVSIDLRDSPDRYFAGPLRMASGDLLMLDRITGLQPPEGQAGGVRAEKDVCPSEWFFKAHFYQDPVQPGSLGLEALVQALQFYVIHYELAEGIPNPAFFLDSPLAWKYRGQVLPTNRRIAVEVHSTRLERNAAGVSVRAEGWLFVDGVRIYHFSDFGLMILSEPAA